MGVRIDQTSDVWFFEDNKDLVSSIPASSIVSDNYTGNKKRSFDNSSETGTNSINNINKQFFKSLLANQPYFINLLLHTNFEDGIYNEASDYVQNVLRCNESVTCNWINHVFDEYRDDEDVTIGILSIIALLNIDSMYLSSLMNILSTAYNSDSPELQVAAIKVMENLRNDSCLRILQGKQSEYSWIKHYANNVITELKKELKEYVA